MTGDERSIESAAPAKAEAAESPVAAVARSQSRRHVISPSETSLSTPGGPVVPDVDLPAASKPVEVAALPQSAEGVGSSSKSRTDPNSGPRRIKSSPPKGLASSAPTSAAKSARPKAIPAKPVASKPAPVESAPKGLVAAAKPVAASKPIPPQHVPTKPVSLKSPPPAAKSAPATPHSKVLPAHGAVKAPAFRATKPSQTTIRTYQPAFSLKDMTMDMSANFSTFQSAMTEAQAKAQAAFEKSSSVLGEVAEFAKGNVEAMVASGKILAEGVQEMGSSVVAESRTAFESMTADVKELAAAKSPTDFLKLQSDMVRKNFDSAVAYSSKNTESFLKLMNDAFAPISGRVSLAVEKARQVAPMKAPASAPAI